MKKLICIMICIVTLVVSFVYQTKACSLIKGDIDNDGVVSMEEVHWILNESITTEQQFSDYNYERADMDGDGDVDINDARTALRIAIGLEEDISFCNCEEVQYPYEQVTFDAPYSSNPLRFKLMGTTSYGGYRWTYYSQRVLPGGGLRIPGRHVDNYGFVCDEEGYICLAYTKSAKENGMIVATPFGRYGKVYDVCESGRMDVYVNW